MTGPGGDDLKYPRAGQPIYQAPRAFYNRVIDLSRADRDRRYAQAAPASVGGHGVLVLSVRNASGAAVNAFGVLELSGLSEDPPPPASVVLPALPFAGVAPTGTGTPFCILADRLEDGEVGLGVVAGCVPAVVTGTGAFAAPQAGNTSVLLAGASGAPIAWVEAGTGDRWAYVLLPAGAGGLRLLEVDGAPNLPGIAALQLDSTDGLILTSVDAVTARLDLAFASTTQTGVMNTAAQSLAGEKTWLSRAYFHNQARCVDAGAGGAYYGQLDKDRIVFAQASPLYVDLRVSGYPAGPVGLIIGASNGSDYTSLSVAQGRGELVQNVSGSETDTAYLAAARFQIRRAGSLTAGVSGTGNVVTALGGIVTAISSVPGVDGTGGWITTVDGVVTGITETIDGGFF